MKNDDGTVYIYNKATNTAAYVESNADGQRIRVGNAYPWTLKEVTTEQGKTGIGIIDTSDTFSWNINPKSSLYVFLKPYDQSASIWEFVKTDEEVPTGILYLTPDPYPSSLNDGAEGDCYDLCGRRVNTHSLPRGIYIHHGKKKLIY